MAEIGLAKREIWDAWEHSKQDKEVQTKEKICSEVGQEGAQNGGKRAQESTKVSIRSEGRVPPAALMAELGKCFDREAKLLGLNNPDKVENEEIKPIQIIRVREALLGRMGRRSMTKIQRSCKLVPTSRQAKTRLNVRPHPPPFCNNRPSPSKSSRNPSLRTGFFRPHNEDLSCGA